MGQRQHRIWKACHVPVRVSIGSWRRSDSGVGGKRTLLAIWLIFPCSFTDTLHPSLEESCSRVERRARRLAAGARPLVQTREKLAVRQESSLTIDDEE